MCMSFSLLFVPPYRIFLLASSGLKVRVAVCSAFQAVQGARACCLWAQRDFWSLSEGWGGEVIALNVLYSILVNIYWLVKTHYGQQSSTICCRCLQVYKHFVTLLSQWLRKRECYCKPHCFIRYKQVFLVLKLAQEIQYHLCLYLTRELFDVWQMDVMCYVVLGFGGGVFCCCFVLRWWFVSVFFF